MSDIVRNYYYWYKVRVLDELSAYDTMEGDVLASSAVSAMKAIEDRAKNIWRSRIVLFQLFGVDMETGETDKTPLLDWKLGDPPPPWEKPVIALPGTPVPTTPVMPEKTSQSVSFDPDALGKKVKVQVDEYPLGIFGETL